MSMKSFIRHSDSSFSLRIDYLISLIPAFIWSLFWFRLPALILVTVSVFAAVFTEALLGIIKNARFTKPSLYCVYCAIVFAFTLYKNTSWVVALLGGVIIALVINIFGGEGRSLIFAPLGARLLIFAFFPSLIGIPEELPYEAIINGMLPTETSFECMLGAVDGSVGAVSVICLILAALYLLLRRISDMILPMSFVVSSFALFFAFPCIQGRNIESAIFELLSSGVVFIAVFFMTDYASTPKTYTGKISVGVLCALITFAFRFLGFSIDSVYIACFASEMLWMAVSVTVNHLRRKNER